MLYAIKGNEKIKVSLEKIEELIEKGYKIVMEG